MVGSINDFTASLAGTLFNSLQTLQCSQKVVPVSNVDSHDESKENKEQANGGKQDSASLSIKAFSAKLSASTESAGPTKPEDLDLKQQQAVRELQQRDQEVRTHEQAHISAGGPHVSGGASYTYQKGPDGREYAIGGSVSIDTSEVPGDPEASQKKAQTVRRAAMAPSNPSAQDQKVASEAAALEAKATQEIAQKRREENSDEAEGETQASGSALSIQNNEPDQESANNARTRSQAIQAYQQSGAPESSTQQFFAGIM